MQRPNRMVWYPSICWTLKPENCQLSAQPASGAWNLGRSARNHIRNRKQSTYEYTWNSQTSLTAVQGLRIWGMKEEERGNSNLLVVFTEPHKYSPQIMGCVGLTTACLPQWKWDCFLILNQKALNIRFAVLGRIELLSTRNHKNWEFWGWEVAKGAGFVSTRQGNGLESDSVGASPRPTAMMLYHPTLHSCWKPTTIHTHKLVSIARGNSKVGENAWFGHQLWVRKRPALTSGGIHTL